jgi:lauroyl/myristoyl acyltransferase
VAASPRQSSSPGPAGGGRWGRAARPSLNGFLEAVRPPLIRVHTSTRTRRLVPVGVAFWLIDLYAALTAMARTWQFETNRRFHHELLMHTPLAGTEARVARRGVAEFYRCSELFWRPWLMEEGQVEGIDHLRAAQSAGRPLVLDFPHFGIPYGQFPIMRRFGIDTLVVASPHHYADLGDGYDGRLARHGLSYVQLLGPGRDIPRAGGTVTEGAFARALEHLQSGGTVSLAFDVVGSLPTPFLGRRINLASGPAKLAHQTDAIVVPFVIRLRRHRPVLTFAPPIDARDHANPSSLQEAIAAVMERWALERPEAVWPLATQPGGPPLIHGEPLSTHASDAASGV